jgi:hypothetical protein
MIVNVKGPVCAVADALTVNVDVPEPLMLGGLKLPLEPEPKPVALRVTAPENPFTAATDTAYAVLFPWTTVAVFGAIVRVKSGVTPFPDVNSNASTQIQADAALELCCPVA